jgi:hypothetical protein
VFHQILEKYGIVHDYYIGGDGGHDWGTWRAHLVYMLPNLWRKDGRTKRTVELQDGRTRRTIELQEGRMGGREDTVNDLPSSR